MANVSKLLHSTAAEESFLRNLTIDKGDDAKLREARTIVRTHLRDTFRSQSQQEFGVIIAPRFFTQGSFSYKTLNEPAWVPPQQMDMDDGCYLPMTFVKGALPAQAASMFFAFVDAALRRLAAEQRWKFYEKPTCSRLEISEDAHIDIPLYAIPDREFRTLEEAQVRKRSAAARDGRVIARDGIESWEELPPDSVLLAHREKDWIVSDPRKIQKWFVRAVETYGENLRRVSRYLKAWRDHHRPDLDALSSIVLMACTFKVFEEIGRSNMPSREDLALLKVVERLPKLLGGPVSNPAEPAEKLDSRLGHDARAKAIGKAEDLLSLVRQAIAHSADCNTAISLMQDAFGDRIPNRPDLVSLTDAARAEVRSHPEKIVPAPTVGRSQSG